MAVAALDGVAAEPDEGRRLTVAIGAVGVAQLLLPLVSRVLLDVLGPASGTVLLMLRSAALLVPAALLWVGVRRRAALWAVVILGAWMVFLLPSTVQVVFDVAVLSLDVVTLVLLTLLTEVATITVGVLAAKRLDLRRAERPSPAGWVAAAGAVAFAASRPLINVTISGPDDTLPVLMTSPLLSGPWTLTVSIVGTMLIAAAAAVAVVGPVAPALAVPIALLPDTVAAMLNDTVVGPVQPGVPGFEMTVALAAGGWLNILALLLLAIAAVMALGDHAPP